VTEMPPLTTIKARADRANDWIRAKASGEATGWVPLSVRVHFGTDVPALLARIAELEAGRDGVRAGALRDAAEALFAMCTDPFDLLTESVGIKGPTAVAVWLTDRANDLDAVKESNDG